MAVVLDEVAAGVEPEETVIPFTRQEEEQPLTMEEEIEETVPQVLAYLCTF